MEKAGFEFDIHWSNESNYKMVSKWKSNVIDVFYFMSTSEMAGREFFELQSTKQGL